MKPLRSMAVRKRPPAPEAGPADDPEAILARLDALAEAAEPRPSAPPEDPPPGRAIWDLEADATPLVLDNPIPPAEPAPPRPKPDAPARAKTRILGFHAQALGTDAIDAARAAPKAPEILPAGWIVVIEGPGRGAHFPVSTQVSTIGRGADQAIALDFGDTTISRENHAAVVYDSEQNRFFLGHGGKSNIVRRNDQPVLATEELFDRDRVRIGKTTLLFVALCGAGFTWDAEDAGGSDDQI